MTDCASRGRASRVGLALGLLLAVAGCGSDSGPSTPAAAPAGTATVKLVPPAGCDPGCSGSALSSVQVSGPETLGPFSMSFGITSVLPFAPPGAYVVTGATFPASTGDVGGCPDAGFTAANGKTTTVTFAIKNDVCTITVAGPV